jgi:hypothetical protein
MLKSAVLQELEANMCSFNIRFLSNVIKNNTKYTLNNLLAEIVKVQFKFLRYQNLQIIYEWIADF